jgi:hypothetical protein
VSAMTSAPYLEPSPIRWKGEDVRPVTECFACGRAYSRGDGRFCTSRCREAFDAGFPPYEPVPTLRDGVTMDCYGCHKPFRSRGLRCCSQDCERAYLAHKDIAATMAEAGMEPSLKRKCITCGGNIPRYCGAGKKRRLTKVTKQTCSPRCQQKAKRQSCGQTAA